MSEKEGKPPVFSSWSGWYWLVMIFAFLQIIGYYLITHSFA